MHTIKNSNAVLDGYEVLGCGRNRHRIGIGLILFALLFLIISAIWSVDVQAASERVSTNSTGEQSNNNSFSPTTSADGRYVVFESEASDLVTGDSNGVYDIFLKDTMTGTITRVSTDSAGGEATGGESRNPAISADGHYIVFHSLATNLVTADTNGVHDIFLKDIVTGTTTRISTDSSGSQANYYSREPAISADGRYVVFYSSATNLVAGDTNIFWDVYMKDTITGAIIWVSTDGAWNEVDNWSKSPDISADGRYVVFESFASNLVPGDTNSVIDIFVKDTVTGVITRVSTDSVGGQSNRRSELPRISADGRYMVFESFASSLVDRDTNDTQDVFIKDITTGVIKRVSTDSTGGEATGGDSRNPAISADGHYVVFKSFASNLAPGDTNSVADIFIKNMVTGIITRVSTNSNEEQGNSDSNNPDISDDGLYVVFSSSATNLVSEDTNVANDIFRTDNPEDIDGDGLWDYIETSLGTDPGNTDTDGDGVSDYDEVNRDNIPGNYAVGTDTDPGNPDTDGDGFFDGAERSFGSDPLDVDSILLNPIRVNTGTIGDEATFGHSRHPATSADGRYVVFESFANNLVVGDTNDTWDIFVKDVTTGTIKRISTDNIGGQSNDTSHYSDISADGRYVVFQSLASNFVVGDTNGVYDIFLKDTVTDTISRVSTDSTGDEATGGESRNAAISADGRYVVFESFASNLVPGDTNGVYDIFLKDIVTGAITRVSTDSTGDEAIDGESRNAAISADGYYVVFESFASNLVPGDTNSVVDIFVKDMVTGDISRASTDSTGVQANYYNFEPGISADGRYVVFESFADNLVSVDTNNAVDIFVKDMVTGLISRANTDSTGSETGTVGDESRNPTISADGRYAVFRSLATNLVTGDTNGVYDIFVKDMMTGVTTRVSTNNAGVEGDNTSYNAAISSNGRYVVFYSDATNLVTGDNNGLSDIFRTDNPEYIPDTDGDGLRDDVEAILGTNPNNNDTDGDGVLDYQEVNMDDNPGNYTVGIDTDPTNADTDNDGFNDGVEIAAGTDPLDINSFAPDGDINMDGEVNVVDILMGQQILSSMIIPSQQQLNHADVAPLIGGVPMLDGQFTTGDLVVIQRKVLNYINF